MVPSRATSRQSAHDERHDKSAGPGRCKPAHARPHDGLSGVHCPTRFRAGHIFLPIAAAIPLRRQKPTKVRRAPTVCDKLRSRLASPAVPRVVGPPAPRSALRVLKLAGPSSEAGMTKRGPFRDTRSAALARPIPFAPPSCPSTTWRRMASARGPHSELDAIGGRGTIDAAAASAPSPAAKK